MQPGFAAQTSNASLPEDAVVRATNCAAAEKMKKKKDDEKTRKVSVTSPMLKIIKNLIMKHHQA
jgi:hypothetical protein